MRKTLMLASLVLTVIAVAVMVGGASGRVRPPFPGDKLDLRSEIPVDLIDVIADDVNTAAPNIGPNIRVNDPQLPLPDGLLGRSETTIATSEDGRLETAGWNDAQGFCGPPFGAPCTPQHPPGLSGWAASASGGLNWKDGGGAKVFHHILTRGDPWMDNDWSNQWYYANLAVDIRNGASLGLSVHRGHFTPNDKFKWDDAQTVDSPANAIVPDSDFYDKEAIVAGKGEFSDDVYLTVTNFQELCGNPQFGFGQIEVWRSHDGGDTWQGPAIAGPEAPDSVASCGNEGFLQQSSAPAIGSNGDVYVVWQYGPDFQLDGSITLDDTEIRVARSTDGGATFDPAVTVDVINTMRGNSPVAYNRSRINDHPRIDVDQSTGRIYVTYVNALAPTAPEATIPCPPDIPAGTLGCVAQNLTSSQAYVSYSDNGGQNWSAPTPIAPAPPATGVKRWWPDVTVDANGTVNVVYYESLEEQATANPTDTECFPALGGGIRRTGPNASLVDTWWVHSENAGASWSMPLKLSSVTSNWCKVVSNIRPNLGDYIDATSYVPAGGESWVAAVWADGRNLVPDTFYAHAQNLSTP